MDILNSLNNEQREAVTNTEGYIRVIAGAGSGKTKALTHRYAFLVEELSVSTENILCVTFTNKAAAEMRSRIRRMIGDHDTGYICTFHGFCVQELREDIHLLHYPKTFMIMDEEDQDTLLKGVYEQRGIDTRRFPLSLARDMICGRKESLEYIELVRESSNEQLLKTYNEAKKEEDVIFYGYLYEQKKNYGLDYDDLINFTYYILTKYKDVKEYWQQKMQYVMVDEFQDVSRRQYLIADILSGYHKNLFVVGDPDQTIYSWRGADVKIFLGFEDSHPNTKTIVMNRNYRSMEQIILGSNSLIEKNTNRYKKELRPERENNEDILFFHGQSTKEEAEWIVDKIKELSDKGKTLEDIAILYRAHHVSRAIEEALIKEKVPYVLYSGIEFYGRKEIKDIISYLRMLTISDDFAFVRTVNEPRRNIGKSRMEFLSNYVKSKNCTLYEALKENIDNPIFQRTKAKAYIELIEKYKGMYLKMRMTDVLENILIESGYEEMLKNAGENERLDNLAELKQSIFEYETSAHEEVFLSDYLQSIALFTNMDKEQKKHAVKLMTVHTAKGLEFPVVFVCGMSEGVFPSSRTVDYDGMEEERRLAYVALTRAEDLLFLSDCEGQTYDGTNRCPSRFVFNIDEKYIRYVREIDPEQKQKFLKRIEDSEKLFKELKEPTIEEGTRIKHKHLGEGTVVSIDVAHKCYNIKFDAYETERSIMMTASLDIIG